MRLYLRNEEYSLLTVMSELSTMRCDRALGLWIAGTRASSVDGRRQRLGPRCGRGGDGRRAASRAVRRLRQERRLGPRRGGGNLPAREVLAVFSKPATYPGFVDPPKPRTGSSSRWRHRGEDFISKKETRPSDEIVYRGCCRPTSLTGPVYRSNRSRGYKYPFTCIRLVAAGYSVRGSFCSSQAAASVSPSPFLSLE